MFNFSDLDVKKETPKEVPKKEMKVLIIDTKEYNNTPNIQRIDLGLVPKAIKLRDKAELRLIEPGYKHPVADYIQRAHWCDWCQDVQNHAYKSDNKTRICLRCKNMSKVK